MENIRSLTLMAENMRKLRALKHLTQEELAYRAGLHPYSIGLIERKVKAPSLRSVEKIAGALHVAPWQLLRETEAKDSADNAASAREILEILKHVNAKQADALLIAVKTLAKTLREEKPPAVLRAAETGSYNVIKRKK